MYEIIYNGEVIDTAENTYEAVELVKKLSCGFQKR